MSEKLRDCRKSPWWNIWKWRSLQKQSSVRHFPLFSNLSEDVQRHILSFVATAPYECSTESLSMSREKIGGCSTTEAPTLTHSLPFVSRSFSELTRSSCLWEECLHRAVRHDPLWQTAVESIDWENVADYRSVYQKVVQERIQFTGPVFLMDSATVPTNFDLYLYEPRYRIMMQKLLAIHADDGAVRSPVCFLYAYRGLDGENTKNKQGRQHRRRRLAPAKLVQVQRCWMHPDGSYSVSLQVVAHTYIEKRWMVPGACFLVYAQAVRVQQV
jgi:hypothetical protein